MAKNKIVCEVKEDAIYLNISLLTSVPFVKLNTGISISISNGLSIVLIYLSVDIISFHDM